MLNYLSRISIFCFLLFALSIPQLLASTNSFPLPDSSITSYNKNMKVIRYESSTEQEWNADIYNKEDELIVTIKDDEEITNQNKISKLANSNSRLIRYEKKNSNSKHVNDQKEESTEPNSDDALDGEWNERYYTESLRPEEITVAAIEESKTFLPITNMTALEFRETLVSYALRYNGYPYRRGGTSPRGFDCSGFVYYIYNHFNIPMPRASSKMVKLGRYVPKSELTKGDVLFFRGRNSRSNRIGHVGIVISEQGETPVRFIHASTYRTGVKISDIETNYYPKRYITARRYIEY